MGLADALKVEREKGHLKRCSVCLLIEIMPKDDAKVLVEALEDKTLAATSIARALVAEGYKTNGNNIARHRRRECQGS